MTQTPAADIVERLRTLSRGVAQWIDGDKMPTFSRGDIREIVAATEAAAAEIEALRAREAELQRKLDEAEENINLKADFIEKTINQLAQADANNEVLQLNLDEAVKALKLTDKLFSDAFSQPFEDQHLWLFGDEGIDAWQTVRAILYGFSYEPASAAALAFIRGEG